MVMNTMIIGFNFISKNSALSGISMYNNTTIEMNSIVPVHSISLSFRILLNCFFVDKIIKKITEIAIANK